MNRWNKAWVQLNDPRPLHEFGVRIRLRNASIVLLAGEEQVMLNMDLVLADTITLRKGALICDNFLDGRGMSDPKAEER